MDKMAQVPRSYATLEQHQAEFHPSMTKIEGKIFMHYVSFLIYLGAYRSYISPIIVEKCKLQKFKFSKPWLVQLSTGTKIRIS